MTRPERRALVAVCLLCVGLAVVVTTRFEVTTDLTAFLPEELDASQVAVSRLLANSEMSRTMVLTVGAPSPDAAREGGLALERALRDEPAVAAQLSYLQGGPPTGLERAMYDLYHPRRLGFLADSPEAARERLSDDALRGAARELAAQLAQPMSPLLARLGPSDPLLILPGLFERFEGSQGRELRVVEGRYMTRDERFAVLLLATRASAFDATAQAPVLAGIERAFDAVKARAQAPLTLDQSGLNRFAVRAERAIKADIQRVSLLSVVGFSVLLFALFRSARLLGLSALPLAIGVLSGVAACLLAYGHVHGITLAFGASLLGVALDYVVHLYCQHAVTPASGLALRTIRPALITGAGTTLLGFLALAGAGFAGLTEVAVFSSAGIAGALLATLTVVPALLPSASQRVPQREHLVRGLSAALRWLRGHRTWLWSLPVVAIALTSWSLPRVHMNADFMQMDRLDPALLAEDERVRDRVARFDGLRFVVATGDTEDSALVANARAARALEAAVERRELTGYRSLASLLPPASQQRAVARAVREDPRLGERVSKAFEAEGFRSDAIEPFLKTLRDPPAKPLHYDDLLASPLSPLARPFRLQAGKPHIFLTFLTGVHDASAVEAAVVGIPGCRFVEQGEQLRETNARYQARTVKWLGIGLVLVFVALLLRYRDARRSLAAFVPSVLAAGVTVAALTMAGRGLDLVVLTALLMVVSMGVDYGVFLVDAETADRVQAGADDSHAPAALLSIVVAAVSTLLGFGLLALSQHPLLFSIGLTASVGMCACLLLAPTTLVLLSGSRSAGGKP